MQQQQPQLFDQKLHDLFYKSHLKDLKGHEHADKHVLHLDSMEKAAKAFEMISAEGIHAAPVQDHKTHKWVGIVDLKDFVRYVLHLQQHNAECDTCKYHQIDDDSRPLIEIMNVSGEVVWMSVNDIQSLGDLVQRMHLCRYHRLPVMAPHDPHKLIGMVSQIDIVTWLHSHLAEAGDSIHRPIKDLGLVHAGKQVFSANLQTKLFDVYKHLVAKDIAGCSVVDQAGHLIGNLSVSDLKFKHFVELKNLEMTVEQFLKSQATRHFPIYVREDAKFSDAITQCAVSRVHRVFVCDEHRVVKGVITLTDVLRVLSGMIAKP